MKAMRWALAAVAVGSIARAAITPEDLIGAVDRLTPEQVVEIQQKLEAKLWQPVPLGFFRRMAVDAAIWASTLDTVRPAGVSLSAGGLEVDDVGGADIGVLWRIYGHRLRLGFRAVGWAARDSALDAAAYSRIEVSGSSLALAVNYQWVRSTHWLVWSEAAPGIGLAAMETVDTPAGQPTTLRSLDATFAQLDLQAGVSLRLNPALSLFVAGGYRFAESVDFEEGGHSSSAKLDASGPVVRVGIGVNF